MQAFLFALLFFPLLLHSYILVNRKSQLEQVSLESQLSKAKNEIPLDNPIVVPEVDDNDLTKRLATKPMISLQPDFSTTNVLLQPRKRDTNSTGATAGGAAAAGVGAGVAVGSCCADASDP